MILFVHFFNCRDHLQFAIVRTIKNISTTDLIIKKPKKPIKIRIPLFVLLL